MFDNPLDELVTMPGGAGDVARERLDNPPLPFETPQDTDARLLNQSIVQQRVQQNVNRIKGIDLAQRKIPDYIDQSGNTQPVTDATGAPVTNYDKRNNIGYDSTGAPVQVRYPDATSPPVVEDAFKGVPVTTDPKTGNQYRIRPGLPWDYQGQDPDTTAALLEKQKDKATTKYASDLGRLLTADERQQKRDEVDYSHRAKALASQFGLSGDEDFPTIAQKVTDHFNTDPVSGYASPEANKKDGWFGSGNLTPDAQATRAEIDSRHQAALQQVEALQQASVKMKARKDVIDVQQAQHDALLRQQVETSRQHAASLGVPLPDDGSPMASASVTQTRGFLPDDSSGAAAPEAGSQPPPAIPSLSSTDNGTKVSSDSPAIPGIAATPNAAAAPDLTPEQKWTAQAVQQAQQGQKPYQVGPKGEFKLDDNAPLDSMTAAVQDGVLKNPPPEVWQALKDKQEMVAAAGDHPEIKAAILGLGRAAAFAATAPIGAGTAAAVTAAITSETGPGALLAGGVAGLLGGLASGTVGAWGYSKLAEQWAKSNQTINSFVQAGALHPNYAAAGELLGFGAGLPRAGMKAIGGLAEHAADSLAEASRVAGSSADAVRATQAAMKASTAAGVAATGTTKDVYSVASNILSAVGKSYAESGGGVVKTVEGLTDLAKGTAKMAADAGENPVMAAATKVAARIAIAAGGMAAIDTALKEGAVAVGLSDQHQTLGGAGFAALLGVMASGHGIENRQYSDPQLKDIMLRGWAHDFGAHAPESEGGPSTPQIKSPSGVISDEEWQKMVSGPKPNPLTPEEQEVYSKLNQALIKGVNEGTLGTNQDTWKLRAEQILQSGRKLGVANVGVEGETASEKPAANSPAPPPVEPLKPRAAEAQKKAQAAAKKAATASAAPIDLDENGNPVTTAPETPEAAAPEPPAAPAAEAPVAKSKPALKKGTPSTALATPGGNIAATPGSSGQTPNAQTTGPTVASEAPRTAAEKEKSSATTTAPAPAEQASTVDAAAHEAATSPKNDKTATEAQLEAGNAEVGHVNVGGLRVSIEHPAGTARRPGWKPLVGAHYGRILNTVSGDGEHMDAFVKEGTPTDYKGPVYVVNRHPAGKGIDHKAILGADSAEDALKIHNDNYPAGLAAKPEDVATFRSTDSFRQWATGATRRTAPAKGDKPETTNETFDTKKGDDQAQIPAGNASPAPTPKKGPAQPGNASLDAGQHPSPAAPKHTAASVAKTIKATVEDAGAKKWVNVRPNVQGEAIPPSGIGIHIGTKEIIHNAAVVASHANTIDKLGGDGAAWTKAATDEELSHHRDLLVSGHEFDQKHEAIYRAIPKSTLPLLEAVHPDTKNPANLAAEYVRIVDQIERGEPVTESFIPARVDAVKELVANIKGQDVPDLVGKHVALMQMPLAAQGRKEWNPHLQKEYEQMGRALTTAQNAKDWPAVLKEVEKFDAYYDKLGFTPDGWNRWQRAGDDARQELGLTPKLVTPITKPLVPKGERPPTTGPPQVEKPATTAKPKTGRIRPSAESIRLAKQLEDLLGAAAPGRLVASDVARAILDNDTPIVKSLGDAKGFPDAESIVVTDGENVRVYDLTGETPEITYEAKLTGDKEAIEALTDGDIPKVRTLEEIDKEDFPDSEKALVITPTVGRLDLYDENEDPIATAQILGASAPKEPPIDAAAIRQSYKALVEADRFKMPSVSIGHLAEKAGVTQDAMKSFLVREWQQGRAVFSKGDYSLSDDKTKAGALDLMGERYLNVRFNDGTLGASAPGESPVVHGSVIFPSKAFSVAMQVALAAHNDGVSTPAHLLEFIDALPNGAKFRPYTNALWNLLGAVTDGWKPVTDWAAVAKQAAAADEPLKPKNPKEVAEAVRDHLLSRQPMDRRALASLASEKVEQPAAEPESGVGDRPVADSNAGGGGLRVAEAKTDESKPQFHKKYIPVSTGMSFDIETPANLAEPQRRALERIEKEVGMPLVDQLPETLNRLEELGVKFAYDVDQSSPTTLGASSPTVDATARVAVAPAGRPRSGVDAKRAAQAAAMGAPGGKVAAAVARAKAALQVAADYFTKLEPVTDYRAAKGQWLGSGQGGQSTGRWVSSVETKAMLKAIEGRFPNPLSQMAMIRYAEADGDLNELARQEAASKGPLKEVYARARNLDAAEIQMTKEAAKYFADESQRAGDAGVLEDVLDHYIARFVDESSIPSAQKATVAASILNQSGASKLKTKFDNALHRVFKSVFDLEQVGGRLLATRIGQTMAGYGQSLTQVIDDRTFIKSLFDIKASAEEDPLRRPLAVVSGSAKILDSGDGHKALLVKPYTKPEDASDYRPIDNRALRKWQWLQKLEDGTEVLMQGELLIHPAVWQDLKNTLGTSQLYKVPLVSGITKLQGQAKGLLFGWSGFHFVTEGTHAVGHGVNPFKFHEVDPKNPLTRELVNGGLELDMFSAKAQFGEEFAGTGLEKLLAPLGLGLLGRISDAMGSALFERYIPGIKDEMARDAFQRNLDAHATELAVGKITRAQIAQLSAQEANDAFGGQNNAYAGNNPTRLHAERLGAIAPDFLKSRMKFFARAFTKYGGEQRRALFILAIVMAVVAKTIERLTTGKTQWKKPFTVVTPHREYELRSVPGDIIDLVTDPRRFINGRLSPLISRPILEGITGRDYRGRQRTWEEELMDILKAPIPIGVRGLVDKDAPELSPAEQFGTSVGFRARRHSIITDVRILGHEWQKKQGKEAADEVYPQSKYLTLRNALEDTNLPKARTAYADLLKTGDKEKVGKGFMESLLKPFSGSQATEDAFRASLSPADLAKYREAIGERARARSLFTSISGYTPGGSSRSLFGSPLANAPSRMMFSGK